MKLETWKIKTKPCLDFLKAKHVLAFFIVVFLVLASIKLGQIINEYVYLNNLKDIYTASIVKNPIDYSFLKPFRNWNVNDLDDIDAKAAASLVTGEWNGKSQLIFGRNASKMLPIASLTKLLTAYVALKNYDLEQTTVITPEVVATEEAKGYLRVGEEFTVNELLHSMLIESSNDAAKAIADIMGEKEFVATMNAEAKRMGLNHSYFTDPIGFDPDFPYQTYNYSTAYDLALLAWHILNETKNDPKIAAIFEITRYNKYNISLASGLFHHLAENTNKLLDEFPDMLGGKTGQTPMAGQCLLVVIPKSKGEGYLINVILGSDNRFSEMKKIINWLGQAFVW
jgi:D-alanyl-D-alanine carboxypeptidase